ncbi:hypothetical protein [Aeromonas veronii]|uniref:hypothetical protein n=1 Tax=Aeromonas veronii TaxID=654 RepID=UPI003F7499C6
MSEIKEGSLTFHFPDSAQATKFDEWDFLREYQRENQGVKAVDILAMEDEHAQTCWFVEVKDYRDRPQIKLVELVGIVDQKVRDSLRVLNVAKTDAMGNERNFAHSVSSVIHHKVVLHIEPLPSTSKIFPTTKDFPSLKMLLKSRLNDIDSSPIVMYQQTKKSGVFWSVLQN